MRVLFTAWSWSTHVNQMVPLAWALRCAGHEVLIAVPPGIRDEVAASGLPTTAVGEDADPVGGIRRIVTAPPSAVPAPGGVPRSVAMFTALADAMADNLLALARRWSPDLLVFEPSAYAGPLVASALDVPAVRHLWGSDLMGFMSRKPAIAAAEHAALTPLAERLGATEIELLGELTIDPCPPSMQVDVPVNRIGIRYLPYHGRHVAPGPVFDRTDRPRVCVTWGTTVGRVAPELSRAGGVIRALAGGDTATDAEIVVAVADEQTADLGALPESVTVLRSSSLDRLLSRCDALVGHGGAGTIMTGLTHSLPQLTVPLLPDHRFNAGQLVRTGAGLSIPAEEVEPAAVREAVRRLCVEETFRSHARRLAAEIESQPTPAETAAQLVEFARTRTAPPAG